MLAVNVSYLAYVIPIPFLKLIGSLEYPGQEQSSSNGLNGGYESISAGNENKAGSEWILWYCEY